MMIDKGEIIKAADTITRYCHEYKKNNLCDKYTCDLYYGCIEFYDSDMEYAMRLITETLMDDETLG